MIQTWSGWKRISGGRMETIDAPAGPGVYEIRHTLTGRVMAFGHSADVPKSIEAITLADQIGSWERLLGRRPLAVGVTDVEYRTCAVASYADAKIAARRLLGLR